MTGFLKKWEIALLLALGISLLWGAAAARQQTALSEKLVRLHIIGATNSEADQALKLRARDAVTALLGEALDTAENAEEAQGVIAALLPEIEAAAENATGQAASATLAREHFPTRDYENFSLPAGEYTALRVTLGEGAGRNWWCVVFPPLCSGLGTEALTEVAALTEDEAALLTEADGRIVRFRVLELWDALRQAAEKIGL